MAHSIELAKVFYTLQANTQGLERDLKSAERQFGKLTDYIKANPVAAAGALGVALVGVGIKAAEMAEAVDRSFRKLGALVPGLTANLKQAQQGVAALAKETGRSQEELLATAEEVARQGVENTEDLMTRLRVVTNLARVTGTETTAIAAGLDQVLDVFGLAADKAEEAGARLFTIAKGKAPLEDLFAAIQQAAPGIREAGLSFDVAAQALGQLLAEGKSPKQAATELKSLAAQGPAGVRALEDIAGAATNGAAAMQDYQQAVHDVSAGTEEQLARMHQSWNNFAIALGRVVSGPISRSLDVLSKYLDTLGNGSALDHLLGNSSELLGLFTRTPGGGAAGEPPLPMNGPNPTDVFGLGGAGRPVGLTPEEQKHFDALREEFARTLASFTSDATDDIQAQVAAFQRRLATELEGFTGAYRAQLEAQGQAVLAGLRAQIQMLKAAEAIRTTPTVVGGREQIPLRTAEMERANANLQKEAAAQRQAEEEAAQRHRQAIQDAQLQGAAIEQAARGALQLADAFGIVSDNAAQALESVAQISASVAQLSKLSKVPGGASFTEMLPSVLSLAGALSSLVGSLFGESPEERKRREVQQANTEAILELSHQVGQFGGRLAGTTGSTVTGVAAATRATLAQTGQFGAAFQLPAELAKLGLTMGDLKEVAQSLGISFANSTPSVKELQQLLDAIAANQLASRVGSYAGQLAQLQDIFEVFDITDPLEQLRRLVALFDDPKFGSPALRQALAGLDLSTPEGRAAAEKAIQALVERLGKAPDQGGISLGDLGGMSPEEFRQALLDLEKRLDALGQGSQADVSQFAVQRTITEAQAGLLASLLTTANVWAEQTARNTAAIAAALGASLPGGGLVPFVPAGGTASAAAGGVNITMYLTLAGALDAAGAAQLGNAAIDGMAAKLDALYGAKLRTRKLLAGNLAQV